MRRMIAYAVILIIFAGCATTGSDQNTGVNPMDDANKTVKVNFKTEDGFKIIGTLNKGEENAVIMLHQFSLDRSTYDSLAAKLLDENYTSLAIDLRGHGESTDKNGVRVNYGAFSESDFRNMVLDAKAAKEYLQKNGYKAKVIIGASIGANTAINFLASDQGIEKAVLLSPGLNYKGIDTEKSASKVTAKTLIVASEGDNYSYSSSKYLKQLIPNSEFRQISGSLHGTNMLGPTNLEKEIVEWIAKT